MPLKGGGGLALPADHQHLSQDEEVGLKGCFILVSSRLVVWLISVHVGAKQSHQVLAGWREEQTLTSREAFRDTHQITLAALRNFTRGATPAKRYRKHDQGSFLQGEDSWRNAFALPFLLKTLNGCERRAPVGKTRRDDFTPALM